MALFSSMGEAGTRVGRSNNETTNRTSEKEACDEKSTCVHEESFLEINDTVLFFLRGVKIGNTQR